MRLVNRFDRETIQDRTLLVTSVILWIVVLYYAVTRSIPRGRYGVLFLGIALTIYILDNSENLMEDLDTNSIFTLALYFICLVAILSATIYFYQNYEVLNTIRVGFATDIDYIMAVAIFLPVLYLTYRSYGLPFASVMIAALVYAYFGSYFPGVFQHTGLTWQRMLQLIATDLSGVYGNLNALMAAWIALFLLYAGLMQGYGAFDLIFRISSKLANYTKSGVAQSAVIASMIIGSVNGSGTANTGITGSITIPLMKEGGLRSETAGGIESVASTGGQILPPIMGAGAFLMASIISVPYSNIILAALFPAIIFYGSTVVAVHYATINDLREQAFDVDMSDHLEVKTSREVALEGVRFGIPFIILIYTLVVAQFTIITSALYACVSMFITGVGVPIIRSPSLTTLYTQLISTLDGLKIGATITASIAIIVAAINAIVDVLLTTGIPSTLAVTLSQLAGGSLILALIISMIICIIMGLGMPTSASYLVVALLVAPALVEQFGIPELATHFFVFYAAILATITPPIATGVAVASGIAQTGFWRTAKEAIKIGAPLFLLPFTFIYHPEIVTPNITLQTVFSGLLGLAGGISVVYGFNNPNTISKFGYINSVSYICLGLVIMIHPDTVWRLAALIATFFYLFAVDSIVLNIQNSTNINLLENR